MPDPDTNQVPENRKWFPRFIRQLLAGLALLGGAIALVQYGVTLGKSGLEERIAKYEQTESALRQRLEGLQDARTQTVEELKNKLDRAREVSAGLREELVRSEKSRALAESHLETAKRTISELKSLLAKAEADRDSALAKLTENRPFLIFIMQPSDGAAKLRVSAKNMGGIPARIVYIKSQVWIDEEEGSFEGGRGNFLLRPDEYLGISRFTLKPEEAEGAKQGKVDVRYATCVIYESAGENDKRRWMADLWFTYNHNVQAPSYTFSQKK